MEDELEQATAAQAVRAEKDRLEAVIAEEDFKFVMTHKQSRRFVWRLLARAKIYGSTFSENHAHASFMEGQRNFGLELMADIHKYAPERYIELLTEIKDDNRKPSASSDDNAS